jgi:tetraacyldisaccharide 4'-kinase
LLDRLLAVLTRPLAPIYASQVAARIRKTTPENVAAAVMCVGNLTMGGTGKTPVTMALMEMLRTRDVNAQGLTRGYGGSVKGPVCVDLFRHTAKDVGDEPLILAQAGPVWVSRDRIAGADAAILHEAAAIVMDDGHQNPQLQKDLSIVVIDAEAGWGNRRVFPAGPLREPVTTGLSRADAVILMLPEAGYQPDYAALGLDEVELPVLTAWLEPQDGPPKEKLFAFAGIGRPEKFFRAIAAHGATLTGTKAYPDHHDYSRADLRQLRQLAEQHEARLITTEKDFVRIPAAERDGITAWPVRACFSEPARVQALLDQALDAAASRR